MKKPSLWWVKMNIHLESEPAVLCMAAYLLKHEPFLESIRVTFGRNMTPEQRAFIVPDGPSVVALVCDGLRRIWGAALHHGHKEGRDHVLPNYPADILDARAGVTGLAAAMVKAGWLSPLDATPLRLLDFYEQMPTEDVRAIEHVQRSRDLRTRQRDANVRNSCATPAHAETPACAERSTSVRPREIDREIEKDDRQTDSEAVSSPAVGHPIFDAWNGIAGVQPARVLTVNRLRILDERMADPFFAGNWRAAIARVAASPFCKGENPTGWVATLDWFLREGKVAQILEGSIDPRKLSSPPTTPPHTTTVDPEVTARRQRKAEREAAARKASEGVQP